MASLILYVIFFKITVYREEAFFDVLQAAYDFGLDGERRVADVGLLGLLPCPARGGERLPRAGYRHPALAAQVAYAAERLDVARCEEAVVPFVAVGLDVGRELFAPVPNAALGLAKRFCDLTDGVVYLFRKFRFGVIL